jgi:S1-C subfamily serine protease
MKLDALRRVAPAARTRRGRIVSGVTRVTLPVATLLALVGSVLLTGATFAAATELAPTTVPMVLVGWVAAIGLPFALPLVVVVGVVAALERRQ